MDSFYDTIDELVDSLIDDEIDELDPYADAGLYKEIRKKEFVTWLFEKFAKEVELRNEKER